MEGGKRKEKQAGTNLGPAQIRLEIIVEVIVFVEVVVKVVVEAR